MHLLDIRMRILCAQITSFFKLLQLVCSSNILWFAIKMTKFGCHWKSCNNWSILVLWKSYRVNYCEKAKKTRRKKHYHQGSNNEMPNKVTVFPNSTILTIYPCNGNFCVSFHFRLHLPARLNSNESELTFRWLKMGLFAEPLLFSKKWQLFLFTPFFFRIWLLVFCRIMKCDFFSNIVSCYLVST